MAQRQRQGAAPGLGEPRDHASGSTNQQQRATQATDPASAAKFAREQARMWEEQARRQERLAHVQAKIKTAQAVIKTELGVLSELQKQEADLIALGQDSSKYSLAPGLPTCGEPAVGLPPAAAPALPPPFHLPAEPLHIGAPAAAAAAEAGPAAEEAGPADEAADAEDAAAAAASDPFAGPESAWRAAQPWVKKLDALLEDGSAPEELQSAAAHREGLFKNRLAVAAALVAHHQGDSEDWRWWADPTHNKADSTGSRVTKELHTWHLSSFDPWADEPKQQALRTVGNWVGGNRVAVKQLVQAGPKEEDG